MCKETIKELRKLQEAQNLAPLRRIVCKRLEVADDAETGRLEGTLEKGPHTKGWLVRVINPPTATAADDAIALFAINSQASAANEFIQLLALTGDHLQPDSKHLHVMPAWLRRWTVDALGLDADLETQVAIGLVVEVWELASIDREKCEA